MNQKIPNFRVWHKIEKRFVDLRSINFEDETIGYDAFGEANLYDVAKFSDIIFHRFTGLKDKNGKEIYEGDIIQSMLIGYAYNQNNLLTAVVILDTFGVFYVDINYYFDFADQLDNSLSLAQEYSEVVGNIFQNTEFFHNE